MVRRLKGFSFRHYRLERVKMRVQGLLLWLLLVPVLTLVACLGSGDRGESVGRHRSRLDFSTGDVEGTIGWQGAPVTGLAAQRLRVIVGAIAGAEVDASGAYRAADVPPGDYPVAVWSPGCLPGEQVGSTNVTVAAGVATTASIDITGSAGLVTGHITVNGVALSNPAIYIEGNCSSTLWSSTDQGEFAHFLAPGSYTARVIGPGSVLGTFAFVVTAGATKDLGAVDFSSGDVEGTISWQGAPVTGLAAERLRVIVGTIAGADVDATGAYRAADVPPGDYPVAVWSPGCLPEEQVGSTDATGAPGVATTANIDITTTAGLVTGHITVNGVALSNPAIYIEGSCSSTSWSSTDQGEFAHFVAPGSYTARVIGPGSVLGTFAFVVTAGATTDLGAVDFSSGDVEGAISWQGAPVTGLAAERLWVIVGTIAGADVDAAGAYHAANVPPGGYPIVVWSPGCLPGEQVGSTNATVAAGVSTTANIDITGTAGLVTGHVTVNGVALSNPAIYIEGNCSSTSWSSTDRGEFAHFVAPGSYSARVIGPSSVLGSFQFKTLAGRITDVDIGSTPAGSDISIELSGGLGTVGGISLTFTQVVSAGSTTVVESGAGAPPPTGFRIVGSSSGPVYWDIDTTATYSGPISVCIRYDQADVHGQEQNLRLRHDGGSGWEDITTSVDADTDIICGVTTSLSPFIVVEPLATPDPGPDADADGIADAQDTCAGTAAGAPPDPNGCSLHQLVPCVANWKNHGAYVSAFTAKARAFVLAGIISESTRSQLVASAAASTCGKK
jgi:hypothetical protein